MTQNIIVIGAEHISLRLWHFSGCRPCHFFLKGIRVQSSSLAMVWALTVPAMSSRLGSTNFQLFLFLSLGHLSTEVRQPNHIPLEHRETSLEGREKEEFLELMHKMLQWDPSSRSPARALAQDEWLLKNV